MHRGGMRVVTSQEFARTLAYIMERLPSSVRPKEPGAVAQLIVQSPAFSGYEIQVREGMDFRDMRSR